MDDCCSLVPDYKLGICGFMILTMVWAQYLKHWYFKNRVMCFVVIINVSMLFSISIKAVNKLELLSQFTLITSWPVCVSEIVLFWNDYVYGSFIVESWTVCLNQLISARLARAHIYMWMSPRLHPLEMALFRNSPLSLTQNIRPPIR